MKKTIIWIAVVIVVILLVLGFAKENNEGSKGDTIKIGYVGPLTGDGAVYGQVTRGGIDVAVEEINANGGINGKKIVMSYEDGRCDAKNALSGAQKLKAEGVNIILGATCSGEVLAIAPFAEQNKMLLVSPSGTNPDISKAGDYIFRNVPSDAGRTPVFAEKMASLGYKKVAIVSEQADYPQGLRNSIKENLAKQNLELVFDETFAQDSKDFRTILSKMKASGADVAVLLPRTDSALIPMYNTLSDLNIKLPIFTPGEQMTSKNIKLLGAKAVGTYVVSAPELDSANGIAKKLIEKYDAKYGSHTMDFFIASSYDEPYLIKQAIEMAGSDNPTKVKDALYKIKDFKGAIGTYSFDQNGDIQGIGFVVTQVQ